MRTASLFSVFSSTVFRQTKVKRNWWTIELKRFNTYQSYFLSACPSFGIKTAVESFCVKNHNSHDHSAALVSRDVTMSAACLCWLCAERERRGDVWADDTA